MPFQPTFPLPPPASLPPVTKDIVSLSLEELGFFSTSEQEASSQQLAHKVGRPSPRDPGGLLLGHSRALSRGWRYLTPPPHPLLPVLTLLLCPPRLFDPLTPLACPPCPRIPALLLPCFSQWQPGPNGGMARLEQFLSTSLAAYDLQRVKVDRSSTSQLSPWIHSGTLSVRFIYYR